MGQVNLVGQYQQVLEQYQQVLILLQQMSARLENIETCLHPTDGTTNRPNIVKLSKAWESLGYQSYTSCWRRLSTGHYRVGIEAIDRRSPESNDPDWYLDVEKCLERDRTVPAKRTGHKHKVG